MKKWIVNAISLVIIVAMMATFLVGCNSGNKKPDSDKEPDIVYSEVASSPVAFSDTGKYTTTITADLSGINKSDVVISYENFDRVGYENIMKNKSKEVDINAFYDIKNVAIDELVLNENKTATISFSDEDALKNKTEFYELVVKSRKIVSGIEVQFEDYELVPDIEEVGVNDKTIKITLEIKGSQFKSNITKDQIRLGGSFANLTISSISNGKQYLTMQLTGDIAYNKDASYYPDGVIYVLDSAVNNAFDGYRVDIPVKFDSVTFDAKNLRYDDGIVTLPIYADNIVDTATMTKDDIAFERDVNVIAVVSDKDKATLVLEVADAVDKNSAAQKLNGQLATIGGQKVNVLLASASFYPVFDYITKEDNAFKITTKLYAETGTFPSGISAGAVELSEEFAGASVVSLTRESDTVVDLVIKTPIKDGQSLEQFSITGGITLAGGAMINSWGQEAGSINYTRDFSNKNIGKDLTGNDIDNIKKIVGGFGNTTFGTFASIASGAFTAANALKTGLEFMGIIESDSAQIKSLINKVADQLTESMNYQTKMISALGKDITELSVNAFISSVNKLDRNNRLLNQYIRYAKDDLSKMGINEPYHGYDEQNDLEWKEYSSKLVLHLKEKIKEGGSKYDNFLARYNEMVNLFIAVTADVEMGVNKFDKMCSLTYNTNSIAYRDRVVFFATVNKVLTDSFKTILIYQGYDNQDTWGVDCKEECEMFNKASTILNQKADELYNPKRVPKFDFGVKNLPSFYLFNSTASDTTRVTNWATAGGEIGICDDDIREFTVRMNGRTFAEEMTLAGFDLTRVRNYGKGLVLRYARKKKGSLDGIYYWYYRNYHVFDWDERQPTWDKSLNKHKHGYPSPWIDEHMYIELRHE